MGLISEPYLAKRDIQQEINQVPQTFSSFHNCMAKAYCKYPFIVGCVIGGIIILSLLFCFIRCCMCGVACCSCCCGGCGGRRKKDVVVHHQYNDPYGNKDITTTTSPGYQRSQPPAYEPPQYAFENGNAVNPDALPAMPTWETVKVEVKEEVELGYINSDGHRKALEDGGNLGQYRNPSPSPGLQTGTGGPFNQRGQQSPTLHSPYPNPPAPAPAYQQQQSVNPYQLSGNRGTYDYPNFDNEQQQRTYDQRQQTYGYDRGPNPNYYDDDLRRDLGPDRRRQKEWTVL